MALRKQQREGYKKELARLRKLMNEAKAMQKLGYAENAVPLVNIPTISQLDKMMPESAKGLMKKLRKIDKWTDIIGQVTRDGTPITYREEQLLREQHKKIEERKAKQRKKIDKSQEYYLYGSDFDVYTRPKEFPDLKNMSDKSLKRLKEKYKKQSSKKYLSEQGQRYRNNYMQSIINVYGRIAEPFMNDINSLLMRIPEDDWWMLFEEYAFLSMEFRYDDNIEMKIRFDNFLYDLKRVVGERY